MSPRASTGPASRRPRRVSWPISRAAALFHSALGDLLAAASNKYSGFASASPGAVRLENACVAWLASVIGYPETAAGTLTSGGSIANLTAIVAARDARDPEGGGAVYTTRFAHHCVDKALHIAGRGRAPKRQIATDERYRMSVDALEQALEQDAATASGRGWSSPRPAPSTPARSIRWPRSPSCAAATAPGSMSTAPMAACSRCATKGRALLAGIELADSVALDPHKTLFLPYGTGAVLVRDGRHLLEAFSAAPNTSGRSASPRSGRRPPICRPS